MEVNRDLIEVKKNVIKVNRYIIKANRDLIEVNRYSIEVNRYLIEINRNFLESRAYTAGFLVAILSSLLYSWSKLFKVNTSYHTLRRL